MYFLYYQPHLWPTRRFLVYGLQWLKPILIIIDTPSSSSSCSDAGPAQHFWIWLAAPAGPWSSFDQFYSSDASDNFHSENMQRKHDWEWYWMNTCIVIPTNNERKILYWFLAFFINCKFHTPTNNIRQYQLCEPLSTNILLHATHE